MTTFDDTYSINEDAFTTLEKARDNFKKISMVKSDLTYNYPNNIANPLITVILPTYLRQELFKDALDSILIQKNVGIQWDILVIDNSPILSQSTYAYEIIKKINHPKISYVHNEVNIGAGYNWNRGVLLSKGKWIVFLHDDDTLYENALEIISKIILSKRKIIRKTGYITN